MRKNPSYTALLRPTHLLISEKSVAYTIKWSYRLFGRLEYVLCRVTQVLQTETNFTYPVRVVAWDHLYVHVFFVLRTKIPIKVLQTA